MACLADVTCAGLGLVHFTSQSMSHATPASTRRETWGVIPRSGQGLTSSTREVLWRRLVCMKDSWLLYDYLRRWWLLLLVGASLGAIIGLGYYSTQVHPVEYVVTANMVFEDPEYTGEGTPSAAGLVLLPIGFPSPEEANAYVQTTVSNLVSATILPRSSMTYPLNQNSPMSRDGKLGYLGASSASYWSSAGSMSGKTPRRG